jgi:uncharacterized protein (DUF58 family)
MRDYRKFLDPRVISRLKGLDLRARLIVEGFLVGLHKSPYHGFSVEFAEHRAYNPGDEIRFIDWKVYGRTDRYYIRKFEEETNLKAYLLLDASASMAYPGTGLTKYQYALNLAASIFFLLFLQRDAISLLLYDETTRLFMPPSSTKGHLYNIFKELSGSQPSGRTMPAGVFNELAERIKKRGLVIVLSDLMTDRDAVLQGLKNFRYRKNEVLVFHILDPREIDIDIESPALLKDMETGEKIPYEPERLRPKYKQKIQEFFSDLKTELRENLIDYELLTTNIPYDKALLAYLKKRGKLH